MTSEQDRNEELLRKMMQIHANWLAFQRLSSGPYSFPRFRTRREILQLASVAIRQKLCADWTSRAFSV